MGPIMKTLPIFLCYRQSDGKRPATFLYELLRDHEVPSVDASGTTDRQKLDLYFDHTTPAVGDWRTIHEPYLKRAKAFIVICTPGAKIREGDEDWVYYEIEWWLKNRMEPPILIDPLDQGERYIPDPILRKWGNAQRISIAGFGEVSSDERKNEVLRGRIVGAIVPGAYLIYQQELEQEQNRARQLEIALVAQTKLSRGLRYSLILASVLLVMAVAAFYFAQMASVRERQQSAIAEQNALIARQNAARAEQNLKAEREQAAIAEQNFKASLSIVQRIAGRFFTETLHSQGYPGEEVGKMLQGVADDIGALDPKHSNIDVEIVQFKILSGF
jgi:hypothetical protein